MEDGEPVAYEALTRFGDGRPPERRFADAEAIGLGIELETATLRAAVESAEASRRTPSSASTFHRRSWSATVR